ncbi:hypothetical protein KBD61_00090 [Patescibacteria group bacterium]|nr:hypothetical protein [Patescibacteria group bacterium]MBP9709409.1 hypothetical protein [Patescibacteria group bacterium]
MKRVVFCHPTIATRLRRVYCRYMLAPPTPEQINTFLNEYLTNNQRTLVLNGVKHPQLILSSLDPGTFPNSLIITFGIPLQEDPRQPSQELQKAAEHCLEQLFAGYPEARSYHLTIEYAY